MVMHSSAMRTLDAQADQAHTYSGEYVSEWKKPHKS